MFANVIVCNEVMPLPKEFYMRWLIGISLLFTAQDPTAENVVTRFLSLLRDEPSAASSMLGADGMIVFGDVGFPLTMESFSDLSEAGCAIRSVPRPYHSLRPSENALSGVLIDWECANKDGSQKTHPLYSVFIVDGQKIVAVSFGQEAGGPNPERTKDR